VRMLHGRGQSEGGEANQLFSDDGGGGAQTTRFRL
jgi:hypothetical protein